MKRLFIGLLFITPALMAMNHSSRNLKRHLSEDNLRHDQIHASDESAHTFQDQMGDLEWQLHELKELDLSEKEEVELQILEKKAYKMKNVGQVRRSVKLEIKDLCRQYAKVAKK